jgi:hypothetical protein
MADFVGDRKKKFMEHRAPPWQPGQSGNPKGRVLGSRNRMSESFLEDLRATWGEAGKRSSNVACRRLLLCSLLPDVRGVDLLDQRIQLEHRRPRPTIRTAVSPLTPLACGEGSDAFICKQSHVNSGGQKRVNTMNVTLCEVRGEQHELPPRGSARSKPPREVKPTLAAG